MAKVVSSIRRLGPQIFISENGMVSELKMLPTRASSSKTTEELDTSDVASRPSLSLRGQTTVDWRGLGLGDAEKRTWHPA